MDTLFIPDSLGRFHGATQLMSLDSIKTISNTQYDKYIPILLFILNSSIVIGFLTMTVIQLIKVPMRGYFHKVKVYGWLEEPSTSIYPLKFLIKFTSYFKLRELISPTGEEKRTLTRFFNAFLKRLRQIIGAGTPFSEESDSINKLVNLSTAGNSKAFFQLPINQLCGQIAAAQQILLNEPQKHHELIGSLAGNVFDDISKDLVAISDTESLEEKLEKFFTPEVRSKKRKERYQLFLDARNKIDSAIQRNIDALQISAGIEWRAWLKFAAVIFSGIIFVISILLSSLKLEFSSFIIFTVFISVVSGYLASVFRDVIAVIERWRG